LNAYDIISSVYSGTDVYWHSYDSNSQTNCIFIFWIHRFRFNSYQSNRIKFWCASLDSEVRTMVRFPSGHEKIFLIWSTNVDGESREQQCQKSSPRFQRNQIGSEYRYMAAGTYGERQVICATEMQTSSIVDCDNDNILIFLRNDDDNESFLRALVEALKPGGLPANHSSLYGEDGEGRWIDAYRLLNFNIN
jgi:hypothetical protein